MSPHPRLTSSRREADHRREPPATLVRLSGTPLCFSQPLAGHRSFRLLSYALRSAPPHKFRFQDLEACSSDSGQQSVICEPTRTFFLFLFRPSDLGPSDLSSSSVKLRGPIRPIFFPGCGQDARSQNPRRKILAPAPKVVDSCQNKITFSPMQETLSIKVSTAEKVRLKAEAARRGVKLSTLLKMGLEAVTSDVSPADRPSCYDLSARFFEEPGHIDSSGLRDLSTNKSHLHGFGARP